MSANPDSDERVPIALCLEKLGASPDERYTRCTARSGRLAGLAIGTDGTILWCAPRPVACELWVSRDQRLMALRPAGAAEVRVVRAGREVLVPEEKPVVLRHHDELLFEGVRYRVHVHGTTTEVHPPRRVLTLPRVVTLAAVMASSVACGGQSVEERAPTAAVDASNDGADGEPERDPFGVDDAAVTVLDASDASSEADVIEIRPQPPN